MTPREPIHAQNDHNVFILGAGFSAEAGIPLISGFLNHMRDSVAWLQDHGRTDEADAIGRVLAFRLAAASAAYRVPLDIENIEELFSLASASEGDALTKDVTLGIAATLDYALTAATPKTCEVIVDPSGWNAPKSWVRPAPPSLDAGSPKQDYRCPLYEFYAGLIAGFFNERRAGAANTIVSFNYDLLVEDALLGLGIPFGYGFKKQTVGCDSTAHCAQGGQASAALPVLKLHGSLNWAIPGTRGGKMTVFGNYADVRAKALTPVLVPPTWRKVFNGQLGNVWDAAVRELASATRIIILGFSMPATDVHFKYLLAAGLKNNISLRQILFVNPVATKLAERVVQVLRQDQIDSRVVTLVDATTAQFFFSPDHRKTIGRTLASPYERSPDKIPEWARQ
jgi:hypothetical protein